MDDMISPIVINLERGQTGLGFNIKGGSDIPVFPGDSGIYVAKIKPGGAADQDKRLQEGDKILEVNNFSLADVTHAAAVDFFVSAGAAVSMVVIPGEEQRIARLQKENISKKENMRGIPMAVKIGGFAVILGVTAIVTSFVYMRLKNS